MRMAFTFIGLVDMCLLLCCTYDRRGPQQAPLPGEIREGEPFFNIQFLYLDNEVEKIAKVEIDSLLINNTLLQGSSNVPTPTIPIPLLMEAEKETIITFSLKEERNSFKLTHQGILTLSYRLEISKDPSNRMVMHARELQLVNTSFQKVQFWCPDRNGELDRIIGLVPNCTSNETTLKVFLP